MNRLSKIFRPFNCDTKPVFDLNVFKSSQKPTSKSLKVVTRNYLKKNIHNHQLTGSYIRIQLLTNYGFIRPSANGLYYILPAGLRVIEKLTKLVDTRMSAIGAQKMSSPLLLKHSLWQQSSMIYYFLQYYLISITICFSILAAETFVDTKEDLYTIIDRSSNKFILSPVGKSDSNSYKSKFFIEISSITNFLRLTKKHSRVY